MQNLNCCKDVSIATGRIWRRKQNLKIHSAFFTPWILSWFQVEIKLGSKLLNSGLLIIPARRFVALNWPLIPCTRALGWMVLQVVSVIWAVTDSGVYYHNYTVLFKHSGVRRYQRAFRCAKSTVNEVLSKSHWRTLWGKLHVRCSERKFKVAK